MAFFLDKKGVYKLATAIRNAVLRIDAIEPKLDDVEDTANNAIPKVNGATKDNLPVLSETGTLVDSGTNIATIKSEVMGAIIGTSPEEADTLGELLEMVNENDDAMALLNEAVGKKANATDLTDHTNNKENPHGVTKEQVGLGNVEDKSSETIRGELTKENVTKALGYTPPEKDTVYTLPTATTDIMGGIKASTSISVDENGVASVIDNAHNHEIGNVEGLQTALNERATTAQVQTAQDTADSAKTTAEAAIPKLVGAVAGNVAILNEDGTVADGGIKLSVVEGGLRVTYDDGT